MYQWETLMIYWTGLWQNRDITGKLIYTYNARWMMCLKLHAELLPLQ